MVDGVVGPKTGDLLQKYSHPTQEDLLHTSSSNKV